MLVNLIFFLLLVAPWLYLSYLNGDAVLLRPTCPECRQARVRQVRDLGEAWGSSTRFSTCPACGRHFRHDGQVVAVGNGSHQDNNESSDSSSVS